MKTVNQVKNKLHKFSGKTMEVAMQETLSLLSIPRMRQIIRKGLKTSFKECTKELKW